MDKFKAKIKAAASIGSVIENAHDGRDEAPLSGHRAAKQNRSGKYRRYDVSFATPSGENDVRIFTGELTVWVSSSGRSFLKEVSNRQFDRKVRNALNEARYAPAPAIANVSAQLPGLSSNIPPSGEMSSPGAGNTGHTAPGDADGSQ